MTVQKIRPKIRKAVFPAAGLGTRFLPATKSIPKEMLTVIDRPVIQYAVEEAKAAGIEEFIFVTGRGKSALEDFFDYSYELNATLMKRGNKGDLEVVNSVVLDPGKVVYTRQQDPLGLGHAVWCARNLIKDEPFAILLADDLFLSKKPCLKQMLEVYDKSPSNMVALMEVDPEECVHYGMVKVASTTGNLLTINGFVEKPEPAHSPSNLAVIGRYLLHPEIFQELESVKTGKNGEIQLTDALSNLLKTQSFFGLKFEGSRFDCGSKTGLLEANIAFALNRKDMRESTLKMLQELMARS
ncbi:MAG: UTP--glucose-1-phosphate uridylyltransferase [Alphaproteobacteria bacterium RIFCSPLOWO2_01_FULL_45_8]|nr:MAG: UTP--glucose-1-phosphate uridylyltransferase [Alphaproteobacteria bacterium GWA1_45_9]OFW89894.1 MAG: UTP--glucose-1-phosphate uridylyltransferase [Alphaproteobacteria bacterium RIFCSPHIGHO2_01_FULL_41_14]OFW96476.1 MAG: UTP--glucose-1-phosphate uridylyltransferase [Alphaproteobacteria bacterium RIFCSPLOWO2_01_FULL_45_8]